MKRYSERSLSIVLGASLLLLPLFARGDLETPLGPLMKGVESLAAGVGGTGVPADPRVVADRHLVARTRMLIRRSGGPVPSVEALLPQVSLAREAALRHRVPVSLVLALIHCESHFQEGAVSPNGAVGLMQLLPTVARDLAASEGLPAPRWLQLLDSRTNIEMGVILLRRLHDRYRSWDLALAAYNAGDRAFVEDGLREDVQDYVRLVSRGARLIRRPSGPRRAA